MPQGGAARKVVPQKSDNNRSSSNSAKRKNFGRQEPANDNNIIVPANDNASQAPNPTNTSPVIKKLSSKPTGSASPAAIKRRPSAKKSRSVGPEAIARPVNQIQMASRLHSDQQKAANDNNLDQTREEMLADSNDTSESTLPGQYNPLEGGNAYGRESSAPPGSMAELPEMDIEKGGGAITSDLERQRAMQLQQGKMASIQQSAGSGSGSAGLPSLSGPEKEKSQTKEESQAETPAKEASSKIFPMGQDSKGSGELDKAGQIAQAVGAERTAKAIKTAQNVKGNLEALRKAQKTLKNFWNLIKAGELAASVSIASLVVLIVTANLQMINKYTFKNNLIPETYFIEDNLIVCTDCGLCGASCISVFAMPMILIPFIAAVIVMGGVLGLDHFGVIDMVGFMSDMF